MTTIDSYIQTLKVEVAKQDPVILGIAIAVLVVLVTIVLFKLITRGRNTKQAILLVGLCDSGKTLLFSRLVHGKYVSSYTSIKENSGIYDVIGSRNKIAEVVDIPGNDRQRAQFWERYKSQARGVIFIIDSTTFQKEIKEVAEYLYTLLSDKTVNTQFLIACNKQDITMAKSSKVIHQQLEKEMNTLRVTRAAALSSTDGSSSGVFLCKRNKDFEFAHLGKLKVDFADCSAKGSGGEGDPELNMVEEWIGALV
ncbi:signal recognition particle receptor subunit beta-like [Amphiura filiformis]|uniref:signal recognition particle receptor subunit beta-like n=1 Tax=Amphiura filiformis TaxID=82378 RepID=UPI003B21A678